MCRALISTTLYAEVPPVPGRQPTYESVEVALRRFTTSLAADDPRAQQEVLQPLSVTLISTLRCLLQPPVQAAFSVCVRVQEEGQGFERLIEAGILKPLCDLVTDGNDAAAACAAVTLGLIAPVAASEVITAGGVEVLLRALHNRSSGKHASEEQYAVAEYAALALGGLAERDPAATTCAILSCPGDLGFRPLIELLMLDGVAAGLLEAVCGTLVNITNDGSPAAAAEAIAPAIGRLRMLAGSRDRGGDRDGDWEDGDLSQLASALVTNVEKQLPPSHQSINPSTHQSIDSSGA